ncbi:MAG TPA: glycosyltransferase family 39 protein [Bauldia sp.]|nr:glycosyltransferase family 39 protein [Bauldia sp.]
MKRLPASLASRFDRRPENFLAVVLIEQVVLWTLVPLLTFRNAPLDVVENLGWGKEWQWGYYKHPPLQAWLTEIAFTLSGGGIWSIYLLSQIAIVLTFVPVYLLGREAAGAKAGVLAVLFLSLVYYANVPTPEFNAGVIQMPIWAWAAFALWRGSTTRKLLWWIALGIAAALAIYAKYSAVILFAALVATSIAVPTCRAAYRTPGPYIAIATALVLAAPQLVWLRSVDFLPLHYAQGRAGEAVFLGRILAPLQFLGAQLLDHAGAILMLAAGGGLLVWRRRTADAVSFESGAEVRRFVLWMAVAPYAFTALFAAAAGYGLHPMWGSPMPIWIGLAVVLLLRPAYRQSRLGPMLLVWGSIFVAAPLATGLVTILGPALAGSQAPRRAAFPGEVIAAQLTALWRQNTGEPLRIVAGDTWTSGVVAAYSPDRPSVFVDAGTDINPWISPQRLATEGALVVWDTDTPEPPPDLASLGPFTAIGKVSAPYPGAHDRIAFFRWAIRPPSRSPGGDHRS